MSYINLIREHEIELAPIRQRAMDGEFRIETFKGVEFPRGSGQVFEFAGTRRVRQDWSSNIITNNGLDNYGTDGMQSVNQAGYCHVGTGNTPPTATDTSLETFVASDYQNGMTYSAKSTPPYYGWTEWKYLFSPGFAGGNVNLNEIGVATGTSSGLTARSLTVDGLGDPTTITVLADEYLECYYRRRNYPAHIVEATGAPTDDQAVVNIDGTDYTYTIRPASATYAGTVTVGTGDGWATGVIYGSLGPSNGFNLGDPYDYGAAGAYNCTLQAVTSQAGVTPKHSVSEAATSYGKGSYTAGTYEKELWWQWGISSAYGAGGIGGLNIKTLMGAYQLVFNNPVPKVYGEVFTYYHSFSWNRKTTWV